MITLDLTEEQAEILLLLVCLGGDQAHDGEWNSEEQEYEVDCEQIFNEVRDQLEAAMEKNREN